MPEHGQSYARAADMVEAALALWDTWDDDARIADKTTERYFDSLEVRT